MIEQERRDLALALLRVNRGAREAASLGMSAADVAYYAKRWPHGIGREVAR